MRRPIDFARWFLPGLGVKRWLIVAALGAVFFVNGISRWLTDEGAHVGVNELVDWMVGDFFPPSDLSYVFMASGIALIAPEYARDRAIARTQLEHAFLYGDSLWAAPDDFTRRKAARAAPIAADSNPTPASVRKFELITGCPGPNCAVTSKRAGWPSSVPGWTPTTLTKRSWARFLPPRKGRTPPASRPAAPAYRTARPHSASTRSAGPACEPWRSPHSKFARESPQLLQPAARNP